MKRVVFSAMTALALAATATFVAPHAHAADPPAGAAATTPSPGASSDPAAAQALFYEARTLMKDGKFAQACPKLEESLRLDYGIGTEFNLADCNEKLGKVATAWSGFLNVASAARSQNQAQREKVARERAKALEPRLPKLTIDITATATPGLEVKRDGVVIGSASWGTAVPVDPGTHRITATAPGRQQWEGSVSVAEAKQARVTVPGLAAATVADNAAAGAAVRGASTTTTTSAAPPPEQPAPFPEPVVERGSTQRTAGWIVAVTGLAGLGVGAGFGIDSMQKKDSSKDHCAGNVCDDEGVAMRERAMTSGNVATIASIAGGAVLLGGLVLVLTAPKGGPHRESNSAKAAAVSPIKSIRPVPQVAWNGSGGGLALQGVLP